jgi:uncharacterized protein
MTLPITLTISAAAALINLWLMIRCGQARTSLKVSIGDGGNDFLVRRMRAHSNFIESAPIVLILIAALEMTSGTSNWLWAIGIAFIVGRLAHPFGMDGGALEKARMAGTLLTFLTLIVLAVMALLAAY